MTDPVPGRGEAAKDHAFEGTARFEAHFDRTGISLNVQRPDADDLYKPVRMDFPAVLFAAILRDLAKGAAAVPDTDVAGRNALRDAARTFHLALAGRGENDAADVSPQDEVRLLHILE